MLPTRGCDLPHYHGKEDEPQKRIKPTATAVQVAYGFTPIGTGVVAPDDPGQLVGDTLPLAAVIVNCWWTYRG